MLLINPSTGKLVDAGDAFADQLLAAGFKKQEPEVAPKTAAKPSARSKKSDK